MMLTGTITKHPEGWAAICDPIGAFAQGDTLTDAIASLAHLIELKVGRRGFTATVTDLGATGDRHDVFITANDPNLLGAEVLKYQRDRHHLSLADVAKRLGTSSRNAYAAYERGERAPSVAKYQELLAAVAPELALTVGPRLGPKAAESKAKKSKAAR